MSFTCLSRHSAGLYAAPRPERVNVDAMAGIQLGFTQREHKQETRGREKSEVIILFFSFPWRVTFHRRSLIRQPSPSRSVSLSSQLISSGIAHPWRPMVLAQKHFIIPEVRYSCPTNVNIPFIKCSSNYPFWLCHHLCQPSIAPPTMPSPHQRLLLQSYEGVEKTRDRALKSEEAHYTYIHLFPGIQGGMPYIDWRSTFSCL